MLQVPFDKLVSPDAQARLSMVRPISSLHEAGEFGDGLIKYAHNTGTVFFAKRAPLQVASTLGFVLNKHDGSALQLTSAELDALHECITWGRIKGNNPILYHWGNEIEQFSTACGVMMQNFRHILPTGNVKARIRASARPTLKPKEAELGSTLGDESTGLCTRIVIAARVRF